MYAIPLNRVVAFAGPYLSAIAGGIASWLVARVNIAGVPGLDQNNLKTAIAGGLAWLLVTGLTWAGQSKWLKGHHIQLTADAQRDAAALSVAPAAPAPVAWPAVEVTGNGFHADALGAVQPAVEDPDADVVADDDLPSDTEEFASPPTPLTDTAAEPVL